MNNGVTLNKCNNFDKYNNFDIYNTNGPFSNYIKQMRSNKAKKNKQNISNQVMGKSPNIEIVDDSDDDQEIVINDNASNSGASDKTISVTQGDDSDIEITPIKQKRGTVGPKKAAGKQRSKLPTIDTSELQFFTNSKKQKPIVEKQEDPENNDSESDAASEESDESDDSISVSESSEASSDASSVKEKKPKLTKREKEKKKQELLIKLIALEKKGVTLTKSYSLKSSLEDIEFEYETQRHSAELEASVHFQQKILMAAVTGVEFLNKKFDPIGAKLTGWSESVMDNINDYEEIFKKLHEKYSERASMPPELQLLVTLVGSGFMFHLTQSLFNSSLPGLGDALKSNPDIMKNIMGAMGQAMNNSQGLQGPLGPQGPQGPQGPPVPQSEQVPVQLREQTQPSFTGPSLNLSNLINNGGPQNVNTPGFPSVQQSIKNVTKAPPSKDDDRFSIASSDTDVSEIKTVPLVSGKGKTKGKSIKI